MSHENITGWSTQWFHQFSSDHKWCLSAANGL